MDPAFEKQINTEEPTEFHKRLLAKCKSLVEMSRRYMGAYYDKWDHNIDVFKGERTQDKQDRDAANRKEPEKMIVPLTFAQVQTFVAFCVSLYTQREHVFELVGTGEEDDKAAKLAEALLQRDLTVNVFEAKLNQFLMDIARFGVGIFKTAWVRETRQELQAVPMPEMMNAAGESVMPMGATMPQLVEVPIYIGNRILNVSPYCFFPDVRLPLTRMQEGEFVASEDLYDMTVMYDLAARGEITGLAYLKPYKTDTDTDRIRTHLTRALEQTAGNASIVSGEQNTLGTVIVTEIQLTLVPSQFTIGEGDNVEYPFGKSNVPEKWLVWYANDNRIVKLEKLDFEHGMYTYDVAEFSPDIHNLNNSSLADLIDKLQDVNSWLINTHITNVRKAVGDRLVVDPSGVNMEDLSERRPVIRLTKQVQGQGVDKFIKQLDVVDITRNHLQDSGELHSLVQTTTGINDNALGQYYTGRRTATEARNANTGAAARLKLVALLIFRTALEPMARKMIANHKQGLDLPTFVQVAGEMSDPAVFQQFVSVTRKDLAGSYDFEVFDGTLPSERAVQAQALEEFMVALMGNPQVVMMLGFDPVKIGLEWLTLRGIRNPKRFQLDQVRQQELLMQLQQTGITQGPNGTEQPNARAGGLQLLSPGGALPAGGAGNAQGASGTEG